jgi:hypothetical protein
MGTGKNEVQGYKPTPRVLFQKLKSIPMWTLRDDNNAWLEGWWISPRGFTSTTRDAVAYVTKRAVEGSTFHIRAVRHVALCKLRNINPASMLSHGWTLKDKAAARKEGWGLVDKELMFYGNSFPSIEVLLLYIRQCAVLHKNSLHIKALRNLT